MVNLSFSPPPRPQVQGLVIKAPGADEIIALIQLCDLCNLSNCAKALHIARVRDRGGEHITTFLHIHTTPTLKVVLRSLDIAIYPNTF